jgi:hypothetical protein
MRKAPVRLIALVVALIAAMSYLTVPASAKSVHTSTSLAAAGPLDQLPVTGQGANGETFTGTLQSTGFTAEGNELALGGLLSGTLTDSSGNSQTVSNTPVSLPLAFPSLTCPVLHLVLGPLDLNLLGLTIHLNQVVLDVTALGAPGNLLGNLLCAIVNLLNGTGTGNLSQLIAQLNQLLGLG